jgi:hypothetical protein
MKVAFIDIDILNEQIIAENGQPINQMPVFTFAAITAGYGIDSDINGTKCITLEKCCPLTPRTITVTNGVTIRVISNVEFIGGRPPVVR